MPQCFVIQPFDKGGKFDRRFRETFKPAIENAGFDAYRVDNDPSVTIPITAIEEQIRTSDVCLADVTQMNPNVWFELGFALAARKDVVIVCEEGAYPHYPFDIQHRRVIAYSGQSASDFDALEKQIETRLESLKTQQQNRDNLAALPPMKDTSGLSAHEVAALVLVIQNSIVPEDDDISVWYLKNEMERLGFTQAATAVAVHKLARRHFVESVRREDPSSGEDYTGYIATELGIEWSIANEERLQLRNTRPAKTGSDDLPF
ncbi:hypothetical protein [Vulgatibacter incomptus]|uniref:hypothetical protein n=1 Tax=Vulgatibacter incomptus TaxID=1391653 RepID=UPI00067F9DC0|nr:hypothetical protein [Vulgatibacter incomptus]